MIFYTKQEKQEYIYEQAKDDGDILKGHFRCPICNKRYSSTTQAAECCSDFDDEGMK